MPGEHVTQQQLSATLEPLHRDVAQMIKNTNAVQREVAENSASTRYLAESINKMATDIEPRVRELESRVTIMDTLWKTIKWIGGPSVLALWFFLISNAWTQLSAQQTSKQQHKPQTEQTARWL